MFIPRVGDVIDMVVSVSVSLVSLEGKRAGLDGAEGIGWFGENIHAEQQMQNSKCRTANAEQQMQNSKCSHSTRFKLSKEAQLPFPYLHDVLLSSDELIDKGVCP